MVCGLLCGELVELLLWHSNGCFAMHQVEEQRLLQLEASQLRVALDDWCFALCKDVELRLWRLKGGCFVTCEVVGRVVASQSKVFDFMGNFILFFMGKVFELQPRYDNC